jgi:4-phospho-D-threonate 3-dehydrogenase / 4-phospho-D-erythronate 3-dehydrogenase
MSAAHLALTMGDPAGVGPEIILKACRRLAEPLAAGQLRLLVVGSGAALGAAAQAIGCEQFIPQVDEGDAWPNLAFLQARPEDGRIAVGEVQAIAGDFAFQAIRRAVELTRTGRVAGLVTAPLNKEAMNLAGHHYAGHTELLAELTGVKGSVMLLAHGNMRVSHVTTHVALKNVSDRVTPERVRRVIELTHEAVRHLGVASPRIAVAAMNPHAGEGGLFGREDIDVVAPTIAACVKAGLDIRGPIPGDTVFVKLRAGQYDAVIAMYHDQGHIPVKLLGFTIDPKTGAWEALSGVNITLGLPIVRTSVDHGTAFDIAGRGIANEGSLIDAIDYAWTLIKARAGTAHA